MSNSQSFVVTPGLPITVRIQSPQAIEMMIVSNGSQYDLQWSGFGTQGVLDIPAGQQIKLESYTYNSGVVIVLPVDTLGVGGVGSINITSYIKGEPQPSGTWPVTIPAQRVIAATSGGAVIADHLINQGNVGSSSPIIEIQEAGATGDQIFADNQGNLTVSEYVGGILTTIFRLLAGVSPGALNNNVLLGDALRSVQINGTLQVNGKTYAYTGIGTQTSGSNLTGVTCTLSGTSTQYGYTAIPQTGTRNFTDFSASGAESNSFGTGYIANSLLLGFVSNNNDTGVKFTGLHPTAGIDMSGLTVGGGGPALQWPNGGQLGLNGTINNGNSSNPGTLTQTGPSDTQIIQAGFTSLNGGTSGTATMDQTFRGTHKRVFIKLSNFKTAGVGQFMSFPVAFTQGAFITAEDAEAMTVQLATVDQSLQQWTGLPAGAGSAGSVASGAVFKGNGLHMCFSGIDRIQFGSAWAAAHNGVIILEGI